MWQCDRGSGVTAAGGRLAEWSWILDFLKKAQVEDQPPCEQPRRSRQPLQTREIEFDTIAAAGSRQGVQIEQWGQIEQSRQRRRPAAQATARV